MNETLKQAIITICQECGNERARMMDVVTAVQKQAGCVSDEAMTLIAEQLKIQRVEVESTASFYAFLSKEKKGKYVVRLCVDVVDKIQGADAISNAFSEQLGIQPGETTSDGLFSFEHVPCIGMSDQAPAALVNNTVVTRLTPQKAQEIVSVLKNGSDIAELTTDYGDGNNAHELVRSMVINNVRKEGEVIFAQREPEAGLKAGLALSPDEVISKVKTSKVRGRGGAGFPTGMKWEFTRGAKGETKYIICNADEGEPGTFKDRVLLTEKFDMLCEGMTIAGHAIGSAIGIIYLRGEYAYLRKFLEHLLAQRRQNNLLGKNVLGKDGFDFDIRIQMGAGAYVCGEESSMISSCEGGRGDPKTRPPFPAQRGYLECPTAVNNVETYCSVARILEKGPEWFTAMGVEQSTGTKLLSIAGDCQNPGVYEYPFGVTIRQILEDVGAEDTKAVLIGGPSGTMISSKDFDRTICYNDLATGGAVVVFNQKRNILEVALEYMDFFVEESCGFCTPCRVGNALLRNKLKDIIDGKGELADLEYMQKLGESVKFSSRCGLGQTSPNPILTTLTSFRSEYEAVVQEDTGGMNPSFDIKKALADAEEIMGRKSEIFK
jgi:[NiFe] hydrogenase diaphorase moiety large subunit